MEKGEGKQYHLPYGIETAGKNIKWGRGEGGPQIWEENQDLKEWVWGRISSCRELYTPLRALKLIFSILKKKYLLLFEPAFGDRTVVQGSRHPILEMMTPDVVANDIHADPDNRLLILTGQQKYFFAVFTNPLEQ